ncbi:glycolytic proteins transcriptional activator gcr1 [Paramecium bursaria]
MILLLLVGDFLQSISILLPVAIFGQKPPSNYNGLCQAQAFVQQFGILFQFFWAFNIALAANRGYKQETHKEKQNRIIFSFIFGIFVPLILCIIPLILNSYKPSDDLCAALCFIEFGNIQILIFFLIPIMVIITLNFFLFYEIIIIIYDQIRDKFIWSIVFRLMTYPMILFMAQIWFIIYILESIVNSQTQWNNYRIWCYFISDLIGFFDVIAYGINAAYEVDDSLGKKTQFILQDPSQNLETKESNISQELSRR